MSFSKCAAMALTIFVIAPQVSAAQAITPLYSFADAPDGAAPLTPLTAFGDVLYGTTVVGGIPGGSEPDGGTLFRFDPVTGEEETVYRFKGKSDGSSPEGSLLGYEGLLYGTANTASVGYKYRFGNVFSFDPATGIRTTLHVFKSGKDGAFPLGALMRHGDTLFGTTSSGGANNNGTIYKLNVRTGREKVLYQFSGADGNQPSAGVVYMNAALFGTTYEGGSSDNGTVFRLDLASGTLGVLHSFTGGADGGSPIYSGLTAFRGQLYGVTRIGGMSGQGTIFQIDPQSGAETVLYSFTGGSDGAWPICTLVEGFGKLYGTTDRGGAQAVGTVFELAIATGKFRKLADLTTDGSQPDYGPNAGLLLHGDSLYGVTTYGGANNYGAIYAVKP